MSGSSFLGRAGSSRAILPMRLAAVRVGIGRLQRQQLVQGQAEAVDVAPRVALAGKLFRGHVAQGSDEHVGLRDVVMLHRLGQAEVRDPDDALCVQQEVGRLDVAVQGVVGMGVLQGFGHLPTDQGDAPPIGGAESSRPARAASEQVVQPAIADSTTASAADGPVGLRGAVAGEKLGCRVIVSSRSRVCPLPG